MLIWFNAASSRHNITFRMDMWYHIKTNNDNNNNNDNYKIMSIEATCDCSESGDTQCYIWQRYISDVYAFMWIMAKPHVKIDLFHACRFNDTYCKTVDLKIFSFFVCLFIIFLKLIFFFPLTSLIPGFKSRNPNTVIRKGNHICSKNQLYKNLFCLCTYTYLYI